MLGTETGQHFLSGSNFSSYPFEINQLGGGSSTIIFTQREILAHNYGHPHRDITSHNLIAGSSFIRRLMHHDESDVKTMMEEDVHLSPQPEKAVQLGSSPLTSPEVTCHIENPPSSLPSTYYVTCCSTGVPLWNGTGNRPTTLLHHHHHHHHHHQQQQENLHQRSPWPSHYLSNVRGLLVALFLVFLASYLLLSLVYNGALVSSVQCLQSVPIGALESNAVDASRVTEPSSRLELELSGDNVLVPFPPGLSAEDVAIASGSSPLLSSASAAAALLRAELLHRVRFPRTKRRLPQCVIIGVRKCGTRALLEFLNLHPHIVKATQEVHFFDDDSKYSLGLEWYRRRMPYSFQDQVTVEKSPSYFVTDHVPQRIHAMNRDVKLLLIVREPITRAVSDYTQIQANKLAKKKRSVETFESLAMTADGRVNVDYKALQISLYANFLKQWYDVFPPGQIHVVDGDVLVTDPLSEIRRIEEFLGLEHRIAKENFYFNKTKGFYCLRNETTEKCLSEAKGRKHPQVSAEVVEKLKRYFAPHNERFFEMVGKNFSWPRPSSPSSWPSPP